MPSKEDLRRLFNFLKSHLYRLNLFNTASEDETIIQNERRSTRLYLVLLVTSMMIFLAYYSAALYTEDIFIPSPSLIEYDRIPKEASLQCPCTNIAVKYEVFTEVVPTYHQLCESALVSDEWINRLFHLYEQSWNNSTPIDFRRIGVFQFQTLRSLCQLASDTINRNLQSFNYTDFVQSLLVSPDIFEAQIGSFTKDFIEETPKTFLRAFNFMQDTTAQSLFMTGASITSVRPVTQYTIKEFVRGIVPYPGVNYTFTDNSTCVCSSSTATTCMGLATFDNNVLPGFQTGCYMLNALMNSTLEAFDNQTFINKLNNSSRSFQKLSSSNSHWKIQKLLGQMFVESWSNNTSYDKYFQNCAPKSCSYRKIHHHSFWEILLSLIGFFAGASTVLGILVPILIVKIWPRVRNKICKRTSPTAQTAVVETMPANSRSTRLKRLLQRIKRKLVEFNLFKSIPRSTDETILRQQRHTTRLYLVLLLVTSITLIFYAFLESNTISVPIESPSLETFTQLKKEYPLTLDCPCSRTSFEYKQFFSDIEVEYHEICSSEFITARWIKLQFMESPMRVFFINDIRFQSEMHFQLLSTLCRVAKQTIEDNLQLFYRTKFITPKVIDNLSFQIESNLILEQFKRTVPESYRRTLQLIEANPEINQLIVPLNSIFRSRTDVHNKEVFRLEPELNARYDRPACILGERCECFFLFRDECVLETIIEKVFSPITIPGMRLTVSPIRSVLISTLECFYNETCLSYIIDEINSLVSPTNFSTLRLPSSAMNESENDTIDMRAKKLFIRDWHNQTSSYVSYFNQCRPLSCEYSYQIRFKIIDAITRITGTLGALNFVLKLLVPYLIKLLYYIWAKIISRRQNTIRPFVEIVSTRRVIYDRLRVSSQYIKKSIVEFNIFPVIPSSQTLNNLRRNRRLTRIYFTFLLISLIILVVYTSLTKETIPVTIESPSKEKYLELYNQYPLTFQCSYSNLSVKYDKFIQIEPQRHPICLSDFFSSDRYVTVWSQDDKPDYLKIEKSIPVFDEDDFRAWIQSQMESVSKMCSLSENLLNSALSIWLQRDFVTARMITPDEFDVQINGLIEEFKRTTSNELVLLFKLIQVTNLANQLATIRSSNWEFIVNPIYNVSAGGNVNLLDPKMYHDQLYALTLPRTYNEKNCSCVLQSNCTRFSTFSYMVSNQLVNQTLPNFLSGCLPLDAMLQSSFSCFYNQTCLSLLQTLIYYAKPFPIKTLFPSSSSSSNRTVETILAQLFVEKWVQNVSFDRYYDECAPKLCQYSHPLPFNGAYFVTKTLAILSGLSKILRYIVSFVAMIVIKLINRRRKRKVAPYPNIVGTDLDNVTLNTITNVPITAIEVNVGPIQEQIETSNNRTDRIITICLCLLVIVTIVVASVTLTRKRDTKYIPITTSITTLIPTTEITESTTTSIEMCYMTLINQNETYPIGHDVKSFILRDLNSDSFLDLAVTNYGDHTFSILFGNEKGTFQPQQVYPTGIESYPWGIVSGDFDNDTFSDIAVTLSETNEIVIFFDIASNGSFGRVNHTLNPCYFPHKQVRLLEVHDLNKDGWLDLLFDCNHPVESSYFVAALNHGDRYNYEYRYSRNNFTIADAESIVIGNFDHDGKQNDIGFCDAKNKVFIFSDINYEEVDKFKYTYFIDNIHGTPQSIIRGRFNDDDFDDIALVAPQSNGLHVLLATGDGKFLQQIYHMKNSPTSVVRINFNNDSIDDLAILHSNQTIGIYLGTKLGIFSEEKTSFQIGENCTDQSFRSLTVADINRDGKDDLVFINPINQTIGVLLSANCNKNF
ncbi:unnamed protein product [Adineta steineri]|uniref:Uncharacterized protein n=1 Tax=Adineta steineri TaxID=433720 RepID=A0A819SCU2_9BILA|nr:unnamed protein product [Adineta steineri]CAF4062116.1 unnamed protein product [Adineta steineri]